LTILLCDRLQFLNLKGNYWDVLWIALLLGFVNIIVRPLVMVIIMLVSLPFLLILRLPRLLMQVLGSFGLMFVTNVIMLWLVCKLLGVPLTSAWLASLVITVGSVFASFSGIDNVPGGSFSGGQANAQKAKDDAIDI
jgi:hypothetical protein